MTASCILPSFTHRQVIALLDQLYGLSGELQPLNGERDLNFLFTAETGNYVFKIANENESPDWLDCQQAVFQKLGDEDVFPGQIRAYESVNGKAVEIITDDNGRRHLCRLLNYVEGRLFSDINPHCPELLSDLGKTLGRLDKSLFDFHHDALHRPLLWKIHDGLQVLENYKPLLAAAEKRNLVEHFETQFRDSVLPLDKLLRRSAIHNDANDNNILVKTDSPSDQSINCIIDFGDMVHSWTVAEPAIAAAYAMLEKEHPLETAAIIIKAYHRQLPLNEAEIRVIFELICMRLCMSVCLCTYQRSLEPDNEYLSISEKSAWKTLEKLRQIPTDFAHYVFRNACGLEAVAQNNKLMKWLFEQQANFHTVVNIDADQNALMWLDLGVASPYFIQPAETEDSEKFGRVINRALEDAGCQAGVGGYAEYRLLYNDDAFVDFDGHQRSLHLGIDIFMHAASPICAPLAGKVFSTANHAVNFDYGGCIILQHEIPQTDDEALVFYTLYGHLAPASFNYQTGDRVNPGDQIANLGDIHENGRWPPHLHFQIINNMLGETDTFVGAGSAIHRQVWLSLCPDPNLILGFPESLLNHPATDKKQILKARKQVLNPSLSLSYRDPIHTLRGSMQYLYDETGRRFLDAVNNVAHVGHCHPEIVKAANRQNRLLNTNTRYLYASITDYCERLLEKFPAPLSVCYLVNSGSEANDLALRLAKQYTGRNDIVTVDHAYHGNLGSLIDISPYKHDGRGGQGRPGHVQKARLPDSYRDKASLETYIDGVKHCFQSEAAAFICESISGCGGQVVLPEGYLSAAYAVAREKRALCIADEVQVGFGRVGSHFWGFETQQVTPDIVTLGKPIGNGHPLAAVITTREIADAFNNGMEYFNTFGGNPVSCAIGNAVLDVIEQEELQNNALMVGDFLLRGLQALQLKYPIIGDVRGLGLFIGVEMVVDEKLTPAATQAAYIVERMKQEGILISTDGPFHNVLKIKPPMCFDRNNAEQLIATLDNILTEDFARI